MTYLETLLLIQSRGEKILSQDTGSMFTDKHRYLRAFDGGESPWHQDQDAGTPERRYGRSGEHWVWKRHEEPDDVPAQFPEGT